jgi:hypothetical protein
MNKLHDKQQQQQGRYPFERFASVRRCKNGAFSLFLVLIKELRSYYQGQDY